MIALSQPEEAARGQDDIGDLTGPLVEDELVDSAKFVAIAAMHSLPPHIVGRNQAAGCEGTGNGYFCIDGHGHSPFNNSPVRQEIAPRPENVPSQAMLCLRALACPWPALPQGEAPRMQVLGISVTRRFGHAGVR